MSDGDTKIQTWVLLGPPIILVALAATLYGLARWNVLVFWVPPLMIAFIVAGLGCVAVELIYVPAAMIRMHRDPEQQTGLNTLGVCLGILVILLYPASFFLMPGY